MPLVLHIKRLYVFLCEYWVLRSILIVDQDIHNFFFCRQNPLFIARNEVAKIGESIKLICTFNISPRNTSVDVIFSTESESPSITMRIK